MWLDPVDGETGELSQCGHHQPGQDRTEREKHGEQGDKTSDAPGELEEGEVAATQALLTSISGQRVGGRVVDQFREHIHAGDEEEKGDQ